MESKYHRVDFIASQYLKIMMASRPDWNVFAFLRSTAGKSYRERFQAFAFMRGIQLVTRRTWYMRLVDDDPPDYQIVSPEPAPPVREYVENVRLPEFVRKETGGFSPKGIAAFLFAKKPPSKLGPKTVLAVYLDADVAFGDILEVGSAVQGYYGSSHEVWMHGAAERGDMWFLQRLAPDCRHQEFYSLWPPEARKGYIKM